MSNTVPDPLPYQSPEQQIFHWRAQVAALCRSRRRDDPALLEARTALAYASLCKRIRMVVASAPPLSDEQCEHLAALIRGGRSK